jgi:hypothetical protein
MGAPSLKVIDSNGCAKFHMGPDAGALQRFIPTAARAASAIYFMIAN